MLFSLGAQIVKYAVSHHGKKTPTNWGRPKRIQFEEDDELISDLSEPDEIELTILQVRVPDVRRSRSGEEGEKSASSPIIPLSPSRMPLPLSEGIGGVGDVPSSPPA